LILDFRFFKTAGDESSYAPALKQADDQHYQGKNQQQMNRTAEGVTADHSQGPHDEQNKENRKHEILLAAIWTQAGLLKLAFRQKLWLIPAAIFVRVCRGW
jgi:hypothetical protein